MLVRGPRRAACVPKRHLRVRAVPPVVEVARRHGAVAGDEPPLRQKVVVAVDEEALVEAVDGAPLGEHLPPFAQEGGAARRVAAVDPTQRRREWRRQRGRRWRGGRRDAGHAQRRERLPQGAIVAAGCRTDDLVGVGAAEDTHVKAVIVGAVGRLVLHDRADRVGLADAAQVVVPARARRQLDLRHAGMSATVRRPADAVAADRAAAVGRRRRRWRR